MSSTPPLPTSGSPGPDQLAFSAFSASSPSGETSKAVLGALLLTALLVGACLILAVVFCRLDQRRVSWCGCGVEGVTGWQRVGVVGTTVGLVAQASLSAALVLSDGPRSQLLEIVTGALQSVIQGAVIVFLGRHGYGLGIAVSSKVWKLLVFGLVGVAVVATGLGAWVAAQAVLENGDTPMLLKMTGVLTIAGFTLCLTGLSVAYMHCGAGMEVTTLLVALGAAQGAGVLVWLTDRASWTAVLVVPLPALYELAILLVFLASHASRSSHLCAHAPRPPAFAVKLGPAADRDRDGASSIYSSDRDHPLTIVELPDPSGSPTATKPPPPSVRTSVGSVPGVTGNSRWSADTSEVAGTGKKGRFGRLRGGGAVPPVPAIPAELAQGPRADDRDWGRVLEVELDRKEVIMEEIGAVLCGPVDEYDASRAAQGGRSGGGGMPNQANGNTAQGRAAIQYPQRSHTVDVVPHGASYPQPIPSAATYRHPHPHQPAAPRWYTPPSTFRPDFPPAANVPVPAVELSPPSPQFAHDTRHDSGASDSSLAYLASGSSPDGLVDKGARLKNPYSPGYSFSRGLGGGEGGSGRFKALRRSLTAPAAGLRVVGNGFGSGRVGGGSELQSVQEEEVVWMGAGSAGGVAGAAMGVGRK